MEIEAEVDELDISSIKTGQEVKFTVEANPGETYKGTVKEVRLIPESSDNLVYYYVIILVDNTSGKLLPGMTANVNFIKEKKEDVLTVLNAALRFTPANLTDAEKNRLLFAAGLPPDMSQQDRDAAVTDYDKQIRQQSSGNGKSGENGQTKQGGLSGLMAGGRGFPGAGGPPGGGPGGPHGANGKQQRSSDLQDTSAQATQMAVRKPLWYIDENGKLAAVMVQTGISDLTKTEIIGAGSLTEKKLILKIKVE